MHGFNDTVPWKFCNPSDVFDIALTGLDCALGDNNQEAKELIASIRAQKDSIVSNSTHYAKNEDCTPAPIVNQSDYDNSQEMIDMAEVPWW